RRPWGARRTAWRCAASSAGGDEMPPAARLATATVAALPAGGGGSAAGWARQAARSGGGTSSTGRPPTHRYGHRVTGWVDGGASTYPPSALMSTPARPGSGRDSTDTPGWR